MTTLLITAIGGDISQGVARIVRAVRPDWRIVGTDIHDQHGGTLFVDEYMRVPRATAEPYLTAMKNLAERWQVTWCLPMSEAELGVIVEKGIDTLGKTQIIGMPVRAVKVGLDKLATVRFAGDIGLPVPWTDEARPGTPPRDLPCVFKPRRSAGSKGVLICRDRAEADWVASRWERGIFQELLLPEDQEVTCAVYRTRQGDVHVLALQRRLVGGFTGWAKVIDHPEVREQCRRLAEKLDLFGSINVQMRITVDGPRLFEMNPRISSSVYLRHLLGFRDVEWLLDELEERSVGYNPPPAGMAAARVQDAGILPGNE